MIYAQYTLFLNNIRKAETLRKRFEEEFVYFKDSFVLVNRLVIFPHIYYIYS